MNAKENRNYNGTENGNYNQIALNVSKISKVFVSKAESCLETYQLCCKERRICVYIGPSGGCKSTLLNIIGALDRPTEGMVSIGGVNIFTLKENEIAYMRNRLIGFIFQSFNLVHRMTVQKMLSFLPWSQV